MADILLHPTSRSQLQAASRSQTHALLLVGSNGTGKRTVARDYARQQLGIDSLHNYPYVLELDGHDEAIGIDQIRTLRRFMERKTTGRGHIRRLGLIFSTDTMTAEAANALLKTLEEPPEDSVIILTANNQAVIPATVRSRLQIIALMPVSQSAASEYFSKQNLQAGDIDRAYLLSGGRPALMHTLLNDAEGGSLSGAVNEAKQILAADQFTRLSLVDQFAKDKIRLQRLLFGLERISSALVHTSAAHGEVSRLRQAHRVERQVQLAKRAIEANASLKLVLTDLFTNM